MDECGRGPCCDTSDLSYCGKNRNLLGRDLGKHVASLKDHNGEKVVTRSEAKVDVHSSDFRIAYGGAILPAPKLPVSEP